MVTTKQLGTASVLAMVAIFLVVGMQLRPLEQTGSFGATSGGGSVGFAAQAPVAPEKLQALASVLEDKCVDADADNPMVAGEVLATSVAYGGTQTVTDYCIGAKTVNEAGCVAGQISFKVFTCPGNTQCINGACA